jgi:hypothetical protein
VRGRGGDPSPSTASWAIATDAIIWVATSGSYDNRSGKPLGFEALGLGIDPDLLGRAPLFLGLARQALASSRAF